MKTLSEKNYVRYPQRTYLHDEDEVFWQNVIADEGVILSGVGVVSQVSEALIPDIIEIRW